MSSLFLLRDSLLHPLCCCRPQLDDLLSRARAPVCACCDTLDPARNRRKLVLANNPDPRDDPLDDGSAILSDDSCGIDFEEQGHQFCNSFQRRYISLLVSSDGTLRPSHPKQGFTQSASPAITTVLDERSHPPPPGQQIAFFEIQYTLYGNYLRHWAVIAGNHREGSKDHFRYAKNRHLDCEQASAYASAPSAVFSPTTQSSKELILVTREPLNAETLIRFVAILEGTIILNVGSDRLAALLSLDTPSVFQLLHQCTLKPNLRSVLDVLSSILQSAVLSS